MSRVPRIRGRRLTPRTERKWGERAGKDVNGTLEKEVPKPRFLLGDSLTLKRQEKKKARIRTFRTGTSNFGGDLKGTPGVPPRGEQKKIFTGENAKSEGHSSRTPESRDREACKEPGASEGRRGHEKSERGGKV